MLARFALQSRKRMQASQRVRDGLQLFALASSNLFQFANTSYMDVHSAKSSPHSTSMAWPTPRSSSSAPITATTWASIAYGARHRASSQHAVPLLIVRREPSKREPRTDSPVKSCFDLFPTLVDLCGLPKMDGLEGKSLLPVLEDPTKMVKPAALTQHPRPAYYDRTKEGVPEAMGYSIRTPKVRYTEWRDWTTGKVLRAEFVRPRQRSRRDPQRCRRAAESRRPRGSQGLVEQNRSA